MWSIRARTALVFALAAMALATGVVVFTNVMSLAGVGAVSTVAVEREESEGSGPTTSATEGTTAATAATVVSVVAVRQWRWSAVGVTGAGVLAGGLGWLVSRRMLRPIDRITATANRITASNLHERIDLGGPDDELRRLSRTVDDLLDRMETAFESQRRFVAQASHELRTPLAVQRAAVQIGLHEHAGPEELWATREELLAQNRRTEHLVESLLVLAEADRGLTDAGSAIDLRALADEVTTALAETGREHEVTLTHTARSEPPVRCVTGEPTLVRQLLTNLVGNAVEYNEPGGFVLVVTDDRGFMVENSGPAVPREIAPLLVEPFRRCPSRVGSGRHSGLGLSIVASIAQAHGWQLAIAARDDGGLRVRVDVSPL
ncbi:signal transduction histidine kinase [Curtobacterium sp. PhB130]|uniref:sensor histidine kinase n=1 Tax=Curtobacterium sp. PhB130 TaxID=2485178 RepID=UPI000F4C2FCE|nr:HAMP domain-containing sensor histidine kinase [Curtobacterium sp. PhB130]ROS78298.1 signal transduction histidine kinase [Curtobacterium sp. PhB130]